MSRIGKFIELVENQADDRSCQFIGSVVSAEWPHLATVGLVGADRDCAAKLAMYRLRRLARRHRGAVVAAGLLLLTLLGGIAGTTCAGTYVNLAWFHHRQRNRPAAKRLLVEGRRHHLAALEANPSNRARAPVARAERSNCEPRNK
jgi:hypothetical protein